MSFCLLLVEGLGGSGKIGGVAGSVSELFCKSLVHTGCTSLGFLVLPSYNCDMLCNSRSACNSLSALICITSLGGEMSYFLWTSPLQKLRITGQTTFLRSSSVSLSWFSRQIRESPNHQSYRIIQCPS